MAYFWFGFALVLLYAVIICYYYAKKRHRKVEKPKYNMMKDDEE
jgi:cbb3-type cytochrome oxidase subunit 3